jgi:hypothetical protein
MGGTERFEIGSSWRMRGGEIATIFLLTPNGRVNAFWAGRQSVFTPGGQYWFHDEESEFDLVEEVKP